MRRARSVNSPRPTSWVWSVAKKRGPRRRHTDLESIALATPAHLGDVERAVRKLALTRPARKRPAGGTPLYDTIASSVDELREGWREEAINAVVVLTDGNDHTSKLGKSSSTAGFGEEMRASPSGCSLPLPSTPTATSWVRYSLHLLPSGDGQRGAWRLWRHLLKPAKTPGEMIIGSCGFARAECLGVDDDHA